MVIRFGDQEVYPAQVDEAGLAALAEYMRGDEVRDPRRPRAPATPTATVWGCDLDRRLRRINADYTT